MRLNALFLGSTFLSAFWVTTSAGQTFTRITDPSSPIVTDAYQSGGACWVDLVGDGYLDLFVANGNLTNEPNRLYRNRRPGGFTSVTGSPVVTDGGSSIGGTFGDFDNDGRLDLFVTNRGNFGNFLYRGMGDTLFSKVTTGDPVTDLANSNSSSWVDADNDGDLDLYVVNFSGDDFLYVASPAGVFTKTAIPGMTPGAEFSIPGAWADYDNNGLDDLFVGNAGTQDDYLYKNSGGLAFTRTVIPDGLSTLGASWGDYDNDGYLDLVVTHFSGQNCTLYHNGGPPSFTLTPVTSSAVSVSTGNWVGSGFGDFDNDGAQDLFLARDGGSGALFHNDGPPGYGFTRVTSGPVATDMGNAFGAVWGDYDRDGQLDLFVTDHLAAGNRLYHNGGTSNHWLTVRAVGIASNLSAIGAKIRLTATIGGSSRTQLREVTGQTGYNSQNLDQHFGLGDAAIVDQLVIEWPSGHVDTWTGLAVDALVKQIEGNLVDVPSQGGSSHVELERPSPNPCRGEATVRFTTPSPGRVRLEVFDLRGRRVAKAVDSWLLEGAHSARLGLGAEARAGVYFCRLSSGGEISTVRLLVTR